MPFATTDVVLNQRTPIDDDPVWRLAVTVTRELPRDDPDVPIPPIERTVYFTDPVGVVDGASQQHWLNSDPAPGQSPMRIQAGTYALIGPKGDTDAGRGGNARVIRIDTNQAPPISVTPQPMPDPYLAINDEIKTILPVEIDQPQVMKGANPYTVRLSVSEPFERDNDLGGYDALLPAGETYDPLSDTFSMTLPSSLDLMRPEPEWEKDGTNNHAAGPDQPYRTIHLQRLANPLLPWNPGPEDPTNHNASQDVNPYITIDSMPVDLTIFNSLGVDPSPQIISSNFAFSSRQRGASANNIWSQETSTLLLQDETDPFPEHTLGFLNRAFGGLPGAMGRWVQGDTLMDGSFISPDPLTGNVGDPKEAFPWFAWNNRPFASHLEMLLVPDKGALESFVL